MGVEKKYIFFLNIHFAAPWSLRHGGIAPLPPPATTLHARLSSKLKLSRIIYKISVRTKQYAHTVYSKHQ